MVCITNGIPFYDECFIIFLMFHCFILSTKSCKRLLCRMLLFSQCISNVPFSQAEVYCEDFLTERRDRETAHAQLNNLKKELEMIEQMKTERASLQQRITDMDKIIKKITVNKDALEVCQLLIENRSLIFDNT